MALFLTGKKKITIENEFWEVGNAQLLGSKTVQSNYFSTLQQKEAVFAALADGTIDHINGRRGAVLAVETCRKEFLKEIELSDIPSFFEAVSKKILIHIKEHIYRGKTPYLSISMVLGDRDKIYYYTVGANQIFILHGDDYIPLREQNGVYIREATDTVGIISVGVYDTLSEVELVKLIQQPISTFEKAQHIRMKVIEKKKRQQKNATIILIEGGL